MKYEGKAVEDRFYNYSKFEVCERDSAYVKHCRESVF